MKTSLRRGVGVVIVALGLSGCAATNPIVSEWRNPAYGEAAFKRIMVGGLGGETSVRRNFEDEFVFQLRAIGVDALPSYRYLGEDDSGKGAFDDSEPGFADLLCATERLLLGDDEPSVTMRPRK